jgi:hypothetical protein
MKAAKLPTLPTNELRKLVFIYNGILLSHKKE